MSSLVSCSNMPKEEEDFEQYSFSTCTQLPPNHCFAGTSFFVSYKSRVYLMAAGHSFTGINQYTGTLIEGLSTPPKKIRIADVINRDKPQLHFYNLLNSESKPRFRKSEGYDMAALPVGSDWKPERIFKVSDKTSSDEISVGDAIFYFGCPVRADGVGEIYPIRYDGQIISKTDTSIEAKIYSKHGASGSPVIKKTKNGFTIVGIISGGLTGTDTTDITPFLKAFKAIPF